MDIRDALAECQRASEHTRPLTDISPSRAETYATNLSSLKIPKFDSDVLFEKLSLEWTTSSTQFLVNASKIEAPSRVCSQAAPLQNSARPVPGARTASTHTRFSALLICWKGG